MTNEKRVYPPNQWWLDVAANPDHEYHKGLLLRLTGNGLVVDIIENPSKLPKRAYVFLPQFSWMVLNLSKGGEETRLYVRVRKITDERVPTDHMFQDLVPQVLHMLDQTGINHIRSRLSFKDADDAREFAALCVDTVNAAFLTQPNGRSWKQLSAAYYFRTDPQITGAALSGAERLTVDGPLAYDMIPPEDQFSGLRVPMLNGSIVFQTHRVGSKILSFRGYNKLKRLNSEERFEGTPEQVERYGKIRGYPVRDGRYYLHGLPMLGMVDLFGFEQEFAFWHLDKTIELSQVTTQKSLEADLRWRLNNRWPFIKKFNLMGELRFNETETAE